LACGYRKTARLGFGCAETSRVTARDCPRWGSVAGGVRHHAAVAAPTSDQRMSLGHPACTNDREWSATLRKTRESVTTPQDL